MEQCYDSTFKNLSFKSNPGGSTLYSLYLSILAVGVMPATPSFSSAAKLIADGGDTAFRRTMYPAVLAMAGAGGREYKPGDDDLRGGLYQSNARTIECVKTSPLQSNNSHSYE